MRSLALSRAYADSSPIVAAAPVVLLAIGIAISRSAPDADRSILGQWCGASGATCEEHACGERFAKVAREIA